MLTHCAFVWLSSESSRTSGIFLLCFSPVSHGNYGNKESSSINFFFKLRHGCYIFVSASDEVRDSWGEPVTLNGPAIVSPVVLCTHKQAFSQSRESVFRSPTSEHGLVTHYHPWAWVLDLRNWWVFPKICVLWVKGTNLKSSFLLF